MDNNSTTITANLGPNIYEYSAELRREDGRQSSNDQGSFPAGTFVLEETSSGRIGESSQEYILNLTNIENVTAAHIHSGTFNDTINDPIMVILFNYSMPVDIWNFELRAGDFNSKLVSGTLVGFGIEPDTYVDVHTTQNPDGEIRGQLMEPDYRTTISIE